MFEFFIPNAYAQGAVQNAANAGADATTAGLEGLIRYVASNIDNWIAGVIIAIVFFLLSKMAARAFKKAIIQKKGEDVHQASLVLVERVTVITITIVGVTIAFAINGLNFTAVIGALSLGIGFALKDIIGNFISGVIMLSQNRVRIGDFIKVKDILGTITSIDARATILQAIDGTEVVIPNQTMLGETLISYSTNPFRRVELDVGVDYKTDLPMVTSLIKGILEEDKSIVPQPAPLVLVEGFGDSAININIKFWIETGSSWLNIRSNLANKIKQAFDELGINIPFPIRTLKLDEDDRSFLKTMDSMKKGYVPEPQKVPAASAVRQAAEHSGKKEKIPFSPFKEPKVAATAETPASAVAQNTNPPVPPMATSGLALNQEVVGPVQKVEQTPLAAEVPAVKPVAPPTHL